MSSSLLPCRARGLSRRAPWLVRLALVLAGVHPLALAAAADPPLPAFAGTWQGRIGTLDVQACLSIDGAEYYYRRHGRGIRLDTPGGIHTPETSGRWAAELDSGQIALREETNVPTEPSAPRPTWRLQSDGPDTLVGTWAAADGSRNLPIALKRISPRTGLASAYDGGLACHPSFYAPLRNAVRVTLRDQVFEGHPHRVAVTPDAEAMLLPEGDPHAARINASTMNWLRDQAVLAYTCELNRNAPGGPLMRSLLPLLWTRHWLVLNDVLPDTYCGGAHGNWDLSQQVWNLDSGQRVKTWTWLRGGQQALHVRRKADGSEVESPLMALLKGLHPRNVKGDCDDAMDNVGVLPPYPTPAGLVFPTTFSHAMRACSDNVTLSWARAARHLSPAGQAVAAQFGP